jgi:hypothetical protein
MVGVESTLESVHTKGPWVVWSVAAIFLVASAVLSLLYLSDKRGEPIRSFLA